MREVRVRTPRTVSSVGAEAAVTDAAAGAADWLINLTDCSGERASERPRRPNEMPDRRPHLSSVTWSPSSCRLHRQSLLYRPLLTLLSLDPSECPTPVAAAAVAKRRHVNTTMNWWRWRQCFRNCSIITIFHGLFDVLHRTDLLVNWRVWSGSQLQTGDNDLSTSDAVRVLYVVVNGAHCQQQQQQQPRRHWQTRPLRLLPRCVEEQNVVYIHCVRR